MNPHVDDALEAGPMPHLDEHCEESLRLFGQEFRELHLWLDAFAGTPEHGMRHRRVRHHQAGIEEAVRLFGEEARAPARQHIVSDLRQEGWTEQDPFPGDEAHYRKIGLF